MAMEFEFDIIARETIKPSSPTPHHLRDFRLSFLDQMTPVMYTPVVLFYSPNGNQTDQPAGRSHLLKISLSKVLTGFYPFAGRIRDHTSVECSDDGVEYIEARVHFPLSVALQQPDAMIVRKFLPVDVESEKAVSGGLLLVQVTSFRCGGMAIGVCMSHKLADASTLATFINSWATMAVGSSDAALMTPQFPVASLFPAKESPVPPLQLVPGRCLTRRYLFDAANIAALKAKATSPSVEQPTRVEVVTALLWKCLMSISRSINGRPRLALITHTVNLRGRININPPLTESIVGNLSGMFTAQWEEPDSTDLQALVLKLREGIQELTNKAKETDKNMAEETYQTVLQVRNLAMAKAGDIDIYACSSWCRFLLYEPDFGWGKPTWVSPGCWTYSNTIFLMDTRDGNGIEVLVTLDEEDIGLIDQNEELLEFSLLNPSVMS